MFHGCQWQLSKGGLIMMFALFKNFYTEQYNHHCGQKEKTDSFSNPSHNLAQQK